MKSLRSKIIAAVLVGIATIFLFNLNSHADIIFNNFGPGDSYNFSTGWSVSGPAVSFGPESVAMSFTVSGSNYTLDAIKLAPGWIKGTNELDLALMTNNAGQPGVALETFSLVDVMGQFGHVKPNLTVNSVLHPLLQNGTEYWLVASAISDTIAEWNWNSIGQLGGLYKLDDAEWTSFPNFATATFEITGTPVSVPEPSSMVLLVISALSLVGFRRWWKE